MFYDIKEIPRPLLVEIFDKNRFMLAKISAKPLKCHISAQEGRTGLTKKTKCVPKYGKGPFIPFLMSYDLGIHSYCRKTGF